MDAAKQIRAIRARVNENDAIHDVPKTASIEAANVCAGSISKI